MIEDDDKWWLGIKELAKKNHKDRVAKTPQRIECRRKGGISTQVLANIQAQISQKSGKKEMENQGVIAENE